MLLSTSSWARQQVLRKSNKPNSFTIEIEYLGKKILGAYLSELIQNPDNYQGLQAAL